MMCTREEKGMCSGSLAWNADNSNPVSADHCTHSTHPEMFSYRRRNAHILRLTDNKNAVNKMEHGVSTNCMCKYMGNNNKINYVLSFM